MIILFIFFSANLAFKKICRNCSEINPHPQMSCENIMINGCSECQCKCQRGLIEINNTCQCPSGTIPLRKCNKDSEGKIKCVIKYCKDWLISKL